MPAFKYRYVNFGLRLAQQTREGPRPDGAAESDLYENELVVDVGGVCWRSNGEARPVLDHHFFRKDQFPAAAAAVLHHAKRIYKRFAAQQTVWLVTHRQPDFDAFTAMYLARSLLTGQCPHEDWAKAGLHPQGWRSVKKGQGPIDWFQPNVAGLPPERRWPVLLAAYAACVDNCRNLSCPKHRALHSVLYAAIRRGRDYLRTSDADAEGESVSTLLRLAGGVEFFDEVKAKLEAGLNPLFDSVLETSALFAPELAFLDRELTAYQRDVKRSRRAIVLLQKSQTTFDEWFPAVQRTPLVMHDRKTNEVHLKPSSVEREQGSHSEQPYQQADGIYLRDPECLLFKEWARTDTENSSMGSGFWFTAIAYSQGRPGAMCNTSDYFFAIDPERAGNLHLYNVWARLQTSEIETLFSEPNLALLRQELERSECQAEESGARTRCRAGFEGRAGGAFKAYFDDPWFDGHNYRATLVATPNRGSLMPLSAGHDPVMSLVQQELEGAVFTSSFVGAEPARTEGTTGMYSFFRRELRHDVDVLSGAMAEQIGRVLWQKLDPDGGPGVPTDFLERHLLKNVHWTAVWSRRGVIVAYKPEAEARAKAFGILLAELSRISNAVVRLKQEADKLQKQVEKLQTGPTREAGEHRAKAELLDANMLDENEKIIRTGEDLTFRVAQAKYDLSLPDNRLLSRFFEATRLDEVLAMIHDIVRAATERAQAERQSQLADETRKNTKMVAEVQNKVEVLEVFIVSVYAVELLHALNDTNLHHGKPLAFVLLGGAVAAALIVAMLLRPFKHMSKGHRWIVRLVALAMVVATLGYVTFLPTTHMPEKDSSHGK